MSACMRKETALHDLGVSTCAMQMKNSQVMALFEHNAYFSIYFDYNLTAILPKTVPTKVLK